MTKKKKDVNEMGVGAIAGFQVPLGVKKRKKKVDEMLELNEHVSIVETISYLSELDDESAKVVEGMLDESDYVKLAEMIKQGFKESAIRREIKKRVKEVVRKQPDGQFALYAPNPGKEKGSTKAGTFPTKLAARRAELSRFPPKEPQKLSRLRKDVEQLRKRPELATKKEPLTPTKKPKAPKKPKQPKRESIDRIARRLAESLFREEKKGSDWDEYVSKLSKQAVLADKTFQSYQKAIAKKSEKSLKAALKTVTNALSGASFVVKGGEKGVKKDAEKGRIYQEFSVSDEEGVADVGPIYIFIEDGYPKIEMSSDAKNSLTKIDPQRGRLLRAELIATQEETLDKDETVASSVTKRDEYLTKIEKKVDDLVSDMTSLEITMLKRILNSKFRKIK